MPMPLFAQGPKLRMTCDACTKSKVKCSQTRPTCDRCAKNSNSCVYGISRRAGRTRKPQSTPPKTEWPSLNEISTANIESWEPTSTYRDWTMDNSMYSYQGFSQDFSSPLELSNLSPIHHDSAGPFSLLKLDMLSTSSGNGMEIQNSWDGYCNKEQDIIEPKYEHRASKCKCISDIVACLSSHNTHEAHFPIDHRLGQGRQAAEVCDRVLRCSSHCLKHESGMLALAFLLDRTISIYGHANVEYLTTLSKHTTNVGGVQHTKGSPVLLQNNSYNVLNEETLNSSIQSEASSPRVLRGSLETALMQHNAFISAYHLDAEDEIKLKFDIVHRHLVRLRTLIQDFSSAVQPPKNTISIQEHGGLLMNSDSDMLEKCIVDVHVSAHSELGKLLSRKFASLYHNWEKFREEWNLGTRTEHRSL
ncbi:hypothetical protein B0O99DRAFT_642815 [Bisporella sp. PMI_857]|nr:hypothetical protein B0O99DRAFT_642815 [Bisporella sp. PMI_857]